LASGGVPTAIGTCPIAIRRRPAPWCGAYLPDIPVWPQLPRRSPLSNMYAQFSRGFPGERAGTALAVKEVDSLLGRLEEATTLLSAKGLPWERLLEQCLITQSCGLASLSPEAAESALTLTVGVSRVFREPVLGRLHVICLVRGASSLKRKRDGGGISGHNRDT
jgi:hypothetical protein